MAGEQAEALVEGEGEHVEIEIEEEGSSEAAAPEAKAPKEDKRATAGNSEDDDDDDAPEGETADERKARRSERGRRRRRNRSQYAMQDNLIIAALTQKIQEQDSLLQQVNGKLSEMDLSAASSARERWVRSFHNARAAYAKAVEEGNGQVALNAQEQMEAARRNALYFENKIEESKKAPAAKATADTPSSDEVTATIEGNKQQFYRRNAWVRDLDQEDMALVKEIDDAVAAEGFQPHTSRYWIELEKRLADAFPEDGDDDDAPPRQHHSQSQPRKQTGQFDKPAPAPKKGPPVGGKSDGGKGNTLKVHPEIVATLKEAGIWDGPDKSRRNRLAKEMMERMNASKK